MTLSARTLAGLLALALAAPAVGDDLFAALDADGDGYLGAAELRAGLAEGGWVAADRDGDGRVSPDEFALRGDEPPAGVSARELMGKRVHDRIGDGLGRVDDLLLHERGRVLALEVDGRRIPWERTRVHAQYIFAAQAPMEPHIPAKLRAASELLGAAARVGLPAREAVVEDFVILESGAVAAVVLRSGGRRLFSPWSRVEFLPGEISLN